VIASDDDPYVAIDRAREFGRAWRAEFVDAGAAGHINAASGLGDWPAGRRALDALLARATAA
jgi:predicted alpha/beta hydrolase family esterase